MHPSHSGCIRHTRLHRQRWEYMLEQSKASVEIYPPADRDFFLPGETVRGCVTLDIAAQDTFKAVRVSLLGNLDLRCIADVHRSRRGFRECAKLESEMPQFDEIPQGRSTHIVLQFIEETVDVLPPGEGELAKDVHLYEFEIEIPSQIPARNDLADWHGLALPSTCSLQTASLRMSVKYSVGVCAVRTRLFSFNVTGESEFEVRVLQPTRTAAISESAEVRLGIFDQDPSSWTALMYRAVRMLEPHTRVQVSLQVNLPTGALALYSDQLSESVELEVVVPGIDDLTPGVSMARLQMVLTGFYFVIRDGGCTCITRRVVLVDNVCHRPLQFADGKSDVSHLMHRARLPAHLPASMRTPLLEVRYVLEVRAHLELVGVDTLRKTAKVEMPVRICMFDNDYDEKIQV